MSPNSKGGILMFLSILGMGFFASPKATYLNDPINLVLLNSTSYIVNSYYCYHPIGPYL